IRACPISPLRFLLFMPRPPPRSPLFPYTTLFRSEHTPPLAEGTTYSDMIRSFFFSKKERNIPSSPLPVVKTDLKALPSDSDLYRSEEHTSELQSRENLVCRLLLEKKNTNKQELSD